MEVQGSIITQARLNLSLYGSTGMLSIKNYVDDIKITLINK